MGHFSIGAWPSPAQPSSGGQGFRRSWVQGSGDQGVGQGIKGSQNGSGGIRVSGVHGFRGQGVTGGKGIRGSGGGSGCQKIRGQGVYKGFIGSGVHGFRGQEVMGSGGQGVNGSCIIHTHTGGSGGSRGQEDQGVRRWVRVSEDQGSGGIRVS